MPGSIVNAEPSAVMPWSLCKAFVHSREFPAIENEYRGGESQRSRLADTSRKSWRLAKRLTSADLAALRSFFAARSGPHEPFFFYDPWETSPKFSYDPEGEATAGRYTVRFEGGWSQACSLSRKEASIALIELT